MKPHNKIDLLFHIWTEEPVEFINIDIGNTKLSDLYLFTKDFIVSKYGITDYDWYPNRFTGISWKELKESDSKYFIGNISEICVHNSIEVEYSVKVMPIDDSEIDYVLKEILDDCLIRFNNINDKINSKLEISDSNTETRISIDELKLYSFSMGEGWRLPTFNEMYMFYEQLKLKELIIILSIYFEDDDNPLCEPYIIESDNKDFYDNHTYLSYSEDLFTPYNLFSFDLHTIDQIYSEVGEYDMDDDCVLVDCDCDYNIRLVRDIQ